MKKYSVFSFQFLVFSFFIRRLRRLLEFFKLGAPHSDAGKKYSVFSFQFSGKNLGPRAASPLLTQETFPASECGEPRNLKLGAQASRLFNLRETLPASECGAPGMPQVIQPRDLRSPLRILAVLAFFLCFSLPAEKLEFAGILGNSGEQGKSLVDFSLKRNTKLDDGLGIVYDKHGTLWSSAGTGQINRYSLDGRLLAKFYYQANSNTHMDRMTFCDDKIMILANKSLFVLDINAEPESSAKKLDLKVKRIGMSNVKGLFPALSENKEILLVKNDGSVSKKYSINEEPWDLFLTDENTVNLKMGSSFRTIKDGKLIEEDNPLKFPGTNMQKIGKNWYAHAWHGTIKRLDENMGPDPGIVLGGSSGSFIGHLAGNYEVNQGTAIAKINKNLYAVAGAGSIIHLMEWRTKERNFNLLRRIGPLSQVQGSLAMDEDGRILVPNGTWHWTDGPDTPLHHSTGREGNGQVAFLNGNIAVGGCYIYGSMASIAYGKLTWEQSSIHDRDKKYGFMKNTTGFTILKKDARNVAYFIDNKGNTCRLQINALGKPEKKLGTFKLSVKTPVKSWTTFAKINDDKVLAGGDGFVIEFNTSNSSEWKETKRWKNFSSDSFGNQIYINADKNNLWISDSERHRVLCFDLQGKLIAKYGKIDAAGDDFSHLKSPTAIAGNSKRVVVYDQGNQRLVKLQLK